MRGLIDAANQQQVPAGSPGPLGGPDPRSPFILHALPAMSAGDGPDRPMPITPTTPATGGGMFRNAAPQAAQPIAPVDAPVNQAGMMRDRQQPPSFAGMDAATRGGLVAAPQPEAAAEEEAARSPQMTPLDVTNARLWRLDHDQADPNKPGQTYAQENEGLKHNQSGVSRFFHGMFRNWKNWDGQGGILGGAVNALAGGVGSAASEKYDYNSQKGAAKNKLFREKAYQMQDADFQAKQTTEKLRQMNTVNEIQNRNAGTANTIANQAANRALDKYKAMKHYKRGEDPVLDAELSAGGTFPDKEEGDDLQMQVAPNGQVIVFNKSKGTYSAGKENFAKPKDIDEHDVSDAEFGLKSDKELEDLATAAVAPSAKGRAVRPEIAANAPAKYKNADGSFNEAAWLKDLASDNTDLKASDVYQDLPADDKQRVAQKVAQLRDSQREMAAEVAKFRSALNHRNPTPGATPVTLTQVKEWFKEANKPGKDRAKKLATFYDLLAKQDIR